MMESLRKDWIVEAYQDDRFFSSFAVKFDRDYANEEKADWKNVISCFDKTRTDYDTKEPTRPMAFVEGFNEMSYHYAMKVDAGIMVYHDDFDDTFYVGLIEKKYQGLFDMLFHKLFNENNSNKFVHLRTIHTIPENYKPVQIEILKEEAA